MEVQQIPQVPIQNQAGNQPRPDGNQGIFNQHNNTTPSTSSSASSSTSNNNNSTSNNDASSSSSTAEQNNINDDNANGANNVVVPQQENGRSISWQDIEHALWTFVASLIPTNVPDVGQDDVGM